jgi:hypothetical protein
MGIAVPKNMTTPNDNAKKKNNLRLGLILASVAVVFFVGFMVKMVFFGR